MNPFFVGIPGCIACYALAYVCWKLAERHMDPRQIQTYAQQCRPHRMKFIAGYACVLASFVMLRFRWADHEKPLFLLALLGMTTCSLILVWMDWTALKKCICRVLHWIYTDSLSLHA